MALQVLADHIPPELIAKQQWVLWRYLWRRGKWTKPPFQMDGSFAQSTAPSTWATFADVWGAYRRGGWDGIGFVPLGLTGIDLDKITWPLDGVAREIVQIADSYTERSPSGRRHQDFHSRTKARHAMPA